MTILTVNELINKSQSGIAGMLAMSGLVSSDSVISGSGSFAMDNIMAPALGLDVGLIEFVFWIIGF